MAGKPAAEVHIDGDLVASLLRAQAPQFADRQLVVVDEGWDNVVFRLGDDLAVRMPRRQLGADLVLHEQRWLAVLGPALPLAVPIVVTAGCPDLGYPWPWSVVRWIEGTTALVEPPRDPRRAAAALGAFLTALHRPAPPDAPANPFRGVPLAARHEAVQVHAEAARRPDVAARWSAMTSLPAWSGGAVWVHGDMHPGNVIVAGGAVSGVIDFGDLTSGDPASDLAVAWMLFDDAARPAFRVALPHVDDVTWARGRAWALALGVAIAANSADNPPYAHLAERTLDAALADDG